MHRATCFSGSSVDKVPFNLPSLSGRPPAGRGWLREPCVERAPSPKNWLTGFRLSFKLNGTENRQKLTGMSAHTGELVSGAPLYF